MCFKNYPGCVIKLSRVCYKNYPEIIIYKNYPGCVIKTLQLLVEGGEEVKELERVWRLFRRLLES